MPATNGDGEFRGATRAQIEFLKDQLRDVRVDLKEIAAALDDLRDFRTKVLAYAGLAAACASAAASWVFNQIAS